MIVIFDPIFGRLELSLAAKRINLISAFRKQNLISDTKKQFFFISIGQILKN